MLYCSLGNITLVNPHFYPKTAFDEPVITSILPLGDPNPNVYSGRWTGRIYVYGDNPEGRFKLISEDGAIVGLYGDVTECLVRPLTLFKGLLPC